MAMPLISDEEHQAAATLVSNALNQLSDLFSTYVTELYSISSAKIVLGEAGDVLKSYAEQAAYVQSKIAMIGECHKQACEHFLSVVDAADQVQL